MYLEAAGLGAGGAGAVGPNKLLRAGQADAVPAHAQGCDPRALVQPLQS